MLRTGVSRGALVVLVLFLAGMASPVSGIGILAPTAPQLTDTVLLPTVSAGLERDLASLDPATPYGVFVSFRGGEPSEWAETLSRHGLVTAREWPRVDAAFAVGTIAQVAGLRAEPSIAHLEDNRELRLMGETSSWATRVREIQENVGRAAHLGIGDTGLRGQGIGVAVIDSGIDASHPDLQDRVVRHWRTNCTTPLLVNTDTDRCYGNWLIDTLAGEGTTAPIEMIEVPAGVSSDRGGHGTHVSGIVAGTGAASTGGYPDPAVAPAVQGTFTGVAPSASLFGFSLGEYLMVNVVETYSFILDNYDSFEPRIRVANNSFGDDVEGSEAPSVYNPDSVTARLVRELVGKGVTMVFAAGNSYGDGTNDNTSSSCDDPTPGVICVANYDDGATGSRDNFLDDSSSRGLESPPAGYSGADVSNTWPDVSAPGTFITAACVRQLHPICNAGYMDEARWAPWYSTISGTSMAAPHVAGIAALLLQADPTLTPAAIEDVLQDTAHKFTHEASPGAYVPDPQNEGSTHSFDKGAGLVDAVAALARVKSVSIDEGSRSTVSVAETTTSKAKRSVTASGSASSGSLVAAPVALIRADGGDYDGPGAADIEALTALETPGGVDFTLEVRDITDAGPTDTEIRLKYIVGGKALVTTVVLAADGASIPDPSDTNSAPAASAVVDTEANTVMLSVPFAAMGDPVAGTAVHNVSVLAYNTLLVDAAPSATPPVAIINANFLEMYAVPFTISRPVQAVTITATLDGEPMAVTTSGTGPSYQWTAATTVRGPIRARTLIVTLIADGREVATRRATVTA